jgi:hypothetical protein
MTWYKEEFILRGLNSGASSILKEDIVSETKSISVLKLNEGEIRTGP